ncbi:hypothetical protein SAE01_05110 [Segetibacter aerophilus]|uniref:Uncharacterized protein n=1 Tax=Segetibacter aerophilus TaxID=670293 RepID=A0A512B7T7_9BACT|nr:hypothetical protein SAE01_05110 [Segetibacter aerophilus]
MLLAEVTECYNKSSRDYFGDNGIDVQLLNKEFQEHIVKSNACQHHRKVPDELHSSAQITLAKNKVSAVIKPNRKSDAKRSNHCCNVWTNSKILKMHYPVLLEPVFKNTKKKNVQYGVRTPARCIAKGLQRHELSKQGIEKINNVKQEIIHYPVVLNGARR